MEFPELLDIDYPCGEANLVSDKNFYNKMKTKSCLLMEILANPYIRVRGSFITLALLKWRRAGRVIMFADDIGAPLILSDPFPSEIQNSGHEETVVPMNPVANLRANYLNCSKLSHPGGDWAVKAYAVSGAQTPLVLLPYIHAGTGHLENEMQIDRQGLTRASLVHPPWGFNNKSCHSCYRLVSLGRVGNFWKPKINI